MKRSGDLAELVRAYQAGVWRYLRFLGCDESQADDLTQETFLAVHRKPFAQRCPQASAAYLRSVARNLFLGAIRKSKRQGQIENFDLAEQVWQQYVKDDAYEAWLEALRDCVETVNGRARQAIDLFYRDNRSRTEIGQTLEMTDDGVKSLLRRTRELLRRCVEQKVDLAETGELTGPEHRLDAQAAAALTSAHQPDAQARAIRPATSEERIAKERSGLGDIE
ncbi:MAG: sigma-70 family RNA polymerase sigma factor [Pirellulales bacterium]